MQQLLFVLVAKKRSYYTVPITSTKYIELLEYAQGWAFTIILCQLLKEMAVDMHHIKVLNIL